MPLQRFHVCSLAVDWLSTRVGRWPEPADILQHRQDWK